MSDTFDLKKVCEVCETPIPDSYGNLLCNKCYSRQVDEEAQRQRDEEEDKKKEEELNITDIDQTRLNKIYKETKKNSEAIVGEHGSQDPDPTITDPAYRENPEAPDKDQVIANMAQFVKTGILLYKHQKSMYTFVKNYMIEKTQAHSQFSKHIWKPTVVDVGCGSGTGTNIMSWEADFAWGIDKNEMSINFAKQAYTREKNGIYYTPQVMFDQLDIIKDDKELMKFDIVVAIEIIEHITEWRKFMENIIRNFTKTDKKGNKTETIHTGPNGNFYDGTEFFISTPNRNDTHSTGENNGVKYPKNIFHVREWTSQEFLKAMREYFHEVELYNWQGKRVEETTNASPIFAKCRKPKI